MLTKPDYIWLAQVLAVLSYNWMTQDGAETAFQYFMGRVISQYPNFNVAKFTKEYEKQMQMMPPRIVG